MIILLILSVTMILLGIYHLFALPSTQSASSKKTLRSNKEVMKELGQVLMDFFRKTHITYYICFRGHRFAEGFVMKIVPLFLKADREMGGLGLNEKEIGLYYGTYGAAAFVLGSLLAGYYIARR